MRPHVLVLLALAACGGAQASSEKTEPLGYLVGSWRSVGPSETRVEIDLRADGTFALAYPEDDGSVPCVVTGTVKNLGDGYVYFTTDPESPCGGGEFYYRLEREDVDQFSYIQNSDFYTDCDVPDCTLWTAVRVSGPLVPHELIAAATADATERRDRPFEPAPSPYRNPYYVPPDEPDEPDEPAAPTKPQDPEVAALKGTAAAWAAAIVAGSERGYARVDHGTVMWSASWDVTPYVQADAGYLLAVVVSSAASDARAYLEMDGEALELEYGTSDDGAYIILHNWATIGSTGFRTRDEGGLTVRYSSSYEEPAILVVLEDAAP